MRFAVKIFFLNFILIISGFFIYSYTTKSYFFADSKLYLENENPDVLAAVATSEVFGPVSEAKILQFPSITYNDTRSVPLEDKFRIIRKYSNPTKFTNHLCNPINESNNAIGNTWKNDTLGCPAYTRDPKFIKLNFGSSNQKLLLYNNYSLFSIDNPNKTVKFQSLHIDRFTTNNFTNCGFRYDPSAVYPVLNNGVFYLFSKFTGVVDNRCVQFYDHMKNTRSSDNKTDKLLLGFQVLSNGELNRSYNRTFYGSVDGIPYGPGPQNSSNYAVSIPNAEVIGCSKFDSNNNCAELIGVNQLAYSYSPTGATVRRGNCPRLGKCKVDNWRASIICKAAWLCGADSCPSCCEQLKGFDCSSRALSIYGKPKCGSGWTYAGETACRNIVTYECCKETVYLGGKFSAHLNSFSLSNFTNYSSSDSKFSVTGPESLQSSAVLPEPEGYLKFKNEFNNPNNINFPINFTNELNKTVFISDKYIFKVIKNDSNITIRRYVIDKSKTYSFGGSTYINSSSVSVNITLTSSSLNKFSLDYFKDDIYFLASGGDLYDFYKLQNFNTNSTITSIKINELTDKFPTSYKSPLAFGIVPDGDNAVFYFANNNKIFYTTLKNAPVVLIDIDIPSYKNFLFNGNVYSKDNLSGNFLQKLSNSKLTGNYISPNNVTFDLKYMNNSKTSFFYSDQYFSKLLNFSNFNGTSFNKFNYFTDNVTFAEDIPLSNSQYSTLNPNSTNNFELIAISRGKGIKIDLTNDNILKNFNKYILINLDKNNRSRIMFYLDCSLPAYSQICSGAKFNFKGSVLGHFYLDGKHNATTENKQFINIHENADNIISLSTELKKKKYQNVSSNIIHLNYDYE